MNMKKTIYLFLTICVLTGCRQEPELVTDPADYVSTLVGTLSEHGFSTGNTYPATALPWGMNFWTPVTGRMGDGWAYRYDSHRIRGFKQTHQPSPWINDYGQFAVMPVCRTEYVDQDRRSSIFSHKSETARPYYYQVYLADHDISAEITPTERAAAMRFTYPQSETSGFVVDAYDNGSYVKVIPERQAIVGYTTKNSGGVPENFRNWFVVQFDKPFETISVYDGPEKKVEGAMEFEGNHALACVGFRTARGEKVNVRAASSFISLPQAWTNLEEVGDRSFDEVRDAAKDRWNDILGRIKVGGGTEDQYRTLYSCLYRATLFPRKFYEINPNGHPVHYSPYDGQIHDGYLYTDTGFWDTFRALFPLLNLVYPSVNAEIQQGLANIARENSFLPEWSSPGHRDCMVGNNSASVVADAILKGITPEEDWQTLYECIVHGTENVHPSVSSSGRLGHEYYNTLGYIPYNVGIRENVARTLEYAYNDWCILQLAHKLGRPQEEIDRWAARAENWRNVFDKSHNLMRGRNLDGTFQEPFSPYKWGDAFTEGNSWHYTWSVFHDVEGLKEAMGGNDGFTAMLDSLFVVPPVFDASYYGFRIHEIAEMQVANMGNYAHGNQPAQHVTYLYNWTDEPWKTQMWVRETMNRLYSAAPDGYCGDEDNGQTSAWYIFSALGFYPVCPGADEYAIGTPLFRNAVIHLENGADITICAQNVKESSCLGIGRGKSSKANESEPRNENRPLDAFISEMKFNGALWNENFIRYSDLLDGARLDFQMSDTPNYSRGAR